MNASPQPDEDAFEETNRRNPERSILALVTRGLAYVIPLAILLIVIVIPARSWIVNLVTDDALYYPIVAQNIASGFGSTFDGVTQTNGYHPLWCWLQMPIAALTSQFGPMTYLWFVKLLMAIVIFIALVVWGKLIRKISGYTPLYLTFTVLLGAYWWSVYTLYSGMETALVVLLIGTCLTLANQLLADRKPLIAVALGVAIAACFLARLDTVFFLGVLALALLVKLGRDLRLQFAWMLPAALLPLPYLLWNLTVFGSPVPVSGIRKSVSSPDFGQQMEILVNFAVNKFRKLVGIVPPVALIVALVGACLFFWLIRAEFAQKARILGILWVLPVAATLHFLYTAIFMVEADVYWYQYAEYLSGFLLIALLVASTVSWIEDRDWGWRLSWAPVTVVCIAVVALVVGYAPRTMPRPLSVGAYETAVWAKDHMQPANPRFAMLDPGIFRFVSGFDTIALNGLAGDRAIMNLVKDGNIPAVIAKYDVDYVVAAVRATDISSIPEKFIRYRSDEVNYHGRGRFLIVEASYWDGKATFGFPPWW